MKAVSFALLATSTHAVAVTPVQKVIQLMEDMVAKGTKAKDAEVVQMAAFKTWCETTVRDKTTAIKEANDKIDKLEADIEKYTVDAATLGDEIAAHEADLAAWNGDLKASAAVRGIERDEFDKMHKDYSESVSALERAIAVLKATSKDKKQASLLQVRELTNVNLIPVEAKKTLNAFLQQSAPSGLDVQAPEANAYEFQSGGVVDMLEKLLDKFIQERTVLEKEESDSKHAYELLKQDLEASVDQAEKDVASKSRSKAKRLEQKASAEGDLSDTTTQRDEDQKYMTDAVAECEQKATDFEARQKLRAEEIEAINKAIEIISGGAVKGASEEHLPGFVQESFAQLRSSGDEARARKRVVGYLQDKSGRINSRVLQALALKVQSGDPFVKIRKMINDLITKLMEEAQEEVEHKGFCDQELATNGQTREHKTEAVQTLTAEIDMLDASITKLTEDLAELNAAVADLDKRVAEATDLRQQEKDKNTKTIADAQGAQTAVAQALVVLREFYAKAGEATALVQGKPEIFDKPYTGMGAESGGVVGMLEVIEADFARLEATTSTAEDEAQREYDTFMHDSKVNKAGKVTDIEHKTARKQEESEQLVNKKADLEGTQKELDAALDYFEKLKPSCIGSGESFEDRTQSRKEEIESLQTALRILNGEDI